MILNLFELKDVVGGLTKGQKIGIALGATAGLASVAAASYIIASYAWMYFHPDKYCDPVNTSGRLFIPSMASRNKLYVYRKEDGVRITSYRDRLLIITNSGSGKITEATEDFVIPAGSIIRYANESGTMGDCTTYGRDIIIPVNQENPIVFTDPTQVKYSLKYGVHPGGLDEWVISKGLARSGNRELLPSPRHTRHN